MEHDLLEELVSSLVDDGYFVIQTGRFEERKIRKTYSLLGSTSPLDIISLVKRVNLVVAPDSFVMHAARLTNTPAVILWGPTDPLVFGYDNHIHLTGEHVCEDFASNCLGRYNSKNYATPCPHSTSHCMNCIDILKILEKIKKTFDFL